MKCRHYKFILTAFFIGVGLACNSADQQSEANKLVSEANNLTDKADVLIRKTEARNQKLFDADIQTVEELEAYKIKMKSEAESIIDCYTEASEILKKIAKKFDEAAQMNVREIYKDYAKIKSDEFTRRAAALDIRKGNAQIFIEADLPGRMTDKFDENNSRFEQLMREAEELSSAARNLENENRKFFAKFN